MFQEKKKKKRGKVSNAHQHLISDKEDNRMEIAKTDVRIDTDREQIISQPPTEEKLPL